MLLSAHACTKHRASLCCSASRKCAQAEEESKALAERVAGALSSSAAWLLDFAAAEDDEPAAAAALAEVSNTVKDVRAPLDVKHGKLQVRSASQRAKPTPRLLPLRIVSV